MMPSELPVVIVGAGGHGRVVAATLSAAGRTVAGFVDAMVAAGALIDGHVVLGGDAALGEHPPEACELAIGLGLLPARRVVFERLTANGYVMARVVHPSVILNGTVTIGAGCQLMAGVVIQPGAVLGDNVLVNTRASIDHDVVLGAHVIVSPGAVLCGGVALGQAVTVGPGATIARGIHVGDEAVIGAGAAVVDPVPAGVTVFGIPARSRTGATS